MVRSNIESILETEYTKKTIKENIIIYGTGKRAQDVYHLMTKKGYIITYFINSHLNYVNEVNGLAEIRTTYDQSISLEEKENSTVIVGIFNPFANVHEILQELRSIGYKNILTFTELIDLYENEVDKIMFLDHYSEMILDKDEILATEKLWGDKKSNELYESLIKFRLFKDYDDLMEKDALDTQYFPEDVESFINHEKIRYIDCGAYDGDTIKKLSVLDNVESIVAFEPDLNNYKACLETINEIYKNTKINHINVFPCAVYSDAIQLKFNMDGSTGSNLSEAGSSLVQCISLDQCVGDFGPTHIKMDIEGAEYEALLGAIQTLSKYTPNLAICLYHKPQDLFRIPLLIDKMNLGYKFHLRMYSFSGYETVLYCVK